MSPPFPQTPVQLCQAQTLRDNTTSHKIDYVAQVRDILKNLEIAFLIQKLPHLPDQVVELYWEGSATNGATIPSFNGLIVWLFKVIFICTFRATLTIQLKFLCPFKSQSKTTDLEELSKLPHKKI